MARLFRFPARPSKQIPAPSMLLNPRFYQRLLLPVGEEEGRAPSRGRRAERGGERIRVFKAKEWLDQSLSPQRTTLSMPSLTQS